MVLAYLYAQASLVYYKRSGGLLVLGTSNVDERYGDMQTAVLVVFVHTAV